MLHLTRPDAKRRHPAKTLRHDPQRNSEFGQSTTTYTDLFWCGSRVTSAQPKPEITRATRLTRRPCRAGRSSVRKTVGVPLREGASRGRGADAERRRDGHVDDLYGLPFARHAAIRYHIRPRLSGEGIAALSAGAYSIRQAGLIVAGCR